MVVFLRRWGFIVAACLICLAFAPPALASSVEAVWPKAEGVAVQSDGKLQVDASSAARGYILARVSVPGSRRFKLRILRGEQQLTYDLNSAGDYEVFPLQMGSGDYEVALYENVKGTKYSSEGRVRMSARLSDENAAYLAPNQYVNYELFTTAVQKSDELCAGASAAECYEIVTDFMQGEFAYDFVRAHNVTAGQLPDIDYCYDMRMGICQDLAAVTACMLRVQGVPCKLVIGYADKYYHAWTSTIVDGRENFFDPTAALGALKAKNYQVERTY